MTLPATPIAYGIDFGTSNSAVAVAYRDRVQLVPVAGPGSALVLASIVHLDRHGGRRAGEDARRRFLESGHLKTDCWRCSLAPYGWDTDCRQYRRGGGCNDARLLSGLKHDLARSGFTGTNSWATDFAVADLVAIVLRRLKAQADAACGADVRRLVLGHPVVFAGATGTAAEAGFQLALERLREAAAAAGFEMVELLPEPTAAILGESAAPGVTLATDFGGGTFDVAVMDARSGPPRVIGLQGTAVGGDRLDGVLFETTVGPQLGLETLPNWLFNEMRTPAEAALLMADPGLADVLGRLATPAARTAAAILLEGHAHGFYRAIEAAKVRLSREDEVRLEYRGGRVGLSTLLRRRAFESMIRPELDRVRDTVLAGLQEAGLAPGEVTRVLLTGGSSQIPAFRADLAAIFGEDRLDRRDAFTAVVRGLGVHAGRLWAAAGPAVDGPSLAAPA